mmetsp:Transcript_6589/g.13079  ORF Transcript_6589/g.13079 Transcript_6589/m.13079 type:complete len:760 (+) Transcript_6589:115-2394(+)|eukprot:CAMPEP_0118797652 /NCGR_PEP_ID=MMETSP1161-20130426/169_1 /TAXON_ID=249345 /ORGANISM="Picochlorum oklahomensis, Strain CCMP2329" /LENGTH=759 /DNA_ID=CAMNT_0006724861 /DNA_START=55 /DNA_END=2334 /DNA_ORIENTATION=-
MDTFNLRVRVYHLNNSGTWDDVGTGEVNFVDTGTGTLRITVKSEVDEAELLRHEVDRKIRYLMQGGGTIITWNEPSVKTDVALSFQDKETCIELWSHIDLALSPNVDATGHPMYMLDQHGNPSMGYLEDMYGANGVLEFPDPSLDTLQRISQAVVECSVFQREVVTKQLLKPGYLKEILRCFEMAEEIEDAENVKAAHELIKAGILLNDTSVLELMFSEEHVEGVVAALEYDPTIPEQARVRHRDFIRGNMALKEIVPIKDATCREKIIQAFRILYIRDTVLPKSLDDATYSTLSSMHLFNIVEVLVSLNKNPQFFKALFDKMSAAEKYSEDWRDLLSFLKQLICLSRHLQSAQRNEMFMHLCNLGLFPVLSDVLGSDDLEAKLWAIDCILSTTVHDPVLLRSFVQNNKDGAVILDQLIQALLTENSGGLQEQSLDILKILLDPDALGSADSKNKFVEAFYQKHMSKLMDVIAVAVDTEEGPCPIPTLRLIIDFLSYCITQHSYQAKYYILQYNCVAKVADFLEYPEKLLALAALKCLRTCVLMRDEFYDRYLEKNLLLEEVLRYYINNYQHDTIVLSASIDFLWMLVKEDTRGHLARLMETDYWTQIKEINHDPDLIIELEKGEQSKLEEEEEKSRDHASLVHQDMSGASRHAAAMQIKEEKEEDALEEKYFREEAPGAREMSPLDHMVAAVEKEQATAQIVLDDYPALPEMPPPPRTDPKEEDDEDTIPLTVVPKSVKRRSPTNRITIFAEKRHKDE